MNFALPPQGLSRWREVGSALFGYLRTLSERGIPSHVFEDARRVNELSFTYAERGDPSSWVTGASAAMAYYPPPLWLKGPQLLFEGAEEGLGYLLAETARPMNALPTLSAKSFAAEADMTEPIYGTKYARRPLSAELALWEKPSAAAAALTPPPRNRFLPSRLAIKCEARPLACAAAPTASAPSPEVRPTLLKRGDGTRLHVLQDARFRRPKAFIFATLRSPQLYTSAETALRSELYKALLGDALQELTYDASVAGLSAGVGCDWRGLSLSAGGFDDRLPELLTLVSSQLRSFALTPRAFERRRELLERQLKNAERGQPISLCAYQRSLALETPRYPVEALAAAAQTVTLEQMRDFQRQLLPKAEMEVFVAGNVNEADAANVLESLQKTLGSAPLPEAERPVRLVRKLPAGRPVTRQHLAKNPDEPNSACEVYFQIGPEAGDDWMLLALLAQILEQPFYGELRTKQQLGYIVSSGVSETLGVRGLVFSVQSDVLPPPEVEGRIDAFLEGFRRDTLAKLSAADLDEFKLAIASQALDVDQRLGSQAERFWGEIATRRYDYARPWRVAERLKELSRSQLVAFYDEHLAATAPNRRRLATHIFSQAAAPETPLVEAVTSGVAADEYWPTPPDRIDSIQKSPAASA